MLFMGEEWGSKAPFPFFCDFQGDLAKAVREGRRREFAGAYAKYGDEIPDPLASSTVAIGGAGLVVGAITRLVANGWRWCENCCRCASAKSFPRLAGAAFGGAQAMENGLLTATWRMGDGMTLSSDRQPVEPRPRPMRPTKPREPRSGAAS